MKNNNILKSREDLTKQLKMVECVHLDGMNTTIIEGKKDKKIEIHEEHSSLDIYKNNEGVFSLIEHIKTGEREPFTTGLLFGGGLQKINIFDIRIVNYGNKCINLIITGVDKIGYFTYEKLFFPFYNKRDFEYLFNLYNQEKTNIYISRNNELVNTRKVDNHLYLNNDLGDILMSVDSSNFIEDMEALQMQKQLVQSELQNKYQITDLVKELGSKSYVFIETANNEIINNSSMPDELKKLMKSTFVFG